MFKNSLRSWAATVYVVLCLAIISIEVLYLINLRSFEEIKIIDDMDPPNQIYFGVQKPLFLLEDHPIVKHTDNLLTVSLPINSVKPAVFKEPDDNFQQKIIFPININSATGNELNVIPGIGPVLSQRILTYREKKKFTTIEELIEIKGIGKKKLEKMRPYVVIK